jgi:hypothetical protein
MKKQKTTKYQETLQLLLDKERYSDIIPLLEKGILENNIFCIQHMIYAYLNKYWIHKPKNMERVYTLLELGMSLNDEVCTSIWRTVMNYQDPAWYENPLAKFESHLNPYSAFVNDVDLYEQLKEYGLENNDFAALYYCYKYKEERDVDIYAKLRELKHPLFLYDMVEEYEMEYEQLILTLKNLFLQNCTVTVLYERLCGFDDITKDNIDEHTFKHLSMELHDEKRAFYYYRKLKQEPLPVYLTNAKLEYESKITFSCISKYIRGTVLDRVPKEIRAMIIKEIY